MFVLCVPADGVVLRLVSVLYFLMVEKAEGLLRGHWLAFNIYVPVSSLPSRLSSRYSSRCWRLVRRLVVASRCSVSFSSVAFAPSRVLASCLSCISWGSSRLCVLSWASCLVLFASCFVSFLGSSYLIVPSCRVAFVVCGGSGVGCGGGDDVLLLSYGVGAVASCFSVLRLARRGGGEEDETRRFIQFVFVCV